MRAFASFVAGVRYVFILAVLVLMLLAVGSIAWGIGGIFHLWHGSGALIDPAGWLPDVVRAFIQGAFLYFLAVAFCSLFLAEPPVPQWMQVRNLFQLRTKILTFLSFILPLAFLGRLVDRSSGEELLFIGGGVFLLMVGIFLLIRYGSPSGDEGMSREGNRPADRDWRRDRKRDPMGDRKPGRDKKWVEKQKEDLKFRKEELTLETRRDLGKGTEGRRDSHVTVKPGPRKPRGR